MKFTKQQLDDGLLDDAITIHTESWRWGTRETQVFEFEGKHYQIHLTCVSDDGVQWEKEYECPEVVQKDVVVKQWALA